jgi:ABC-type amino acid transport substrate-binding protein
MQRTRCRWLAALVLALGVLVGAGCGNGKKADSAAGSAASTSATATAKTLFAAGTTMAKLQKAGEIAIGVKHDVPPFGFKNPTTGEVEASTSISERRSRKHLALSRSSSRRSRTTGPVSAGGNG